MAFYGRQRGINRRDGYRSPAPQAVAETLARFRPNPIRRLGILLLSRLGQGVELVFRPKTATWSGRQAASAGPPGLSETPHPSAPSARLRRLTSERSRREQRRDAAGLHDVFDVSEEAAAFREVEASGTAEVVAGPWRLVLDGGQGPEGTFVDVGVLDGESGSAVPGIPVRLTSGAWTLARLTTGADGRARLTPVPDRAEIIVGEDPGYRLSVRDLG
jgi:hypothetical protein